MALRPVAFQTSLDGLSLLDEAVATMATAGVEERGAVFTRRAVVDFILDLAEYTADRPLYQMRLLEPSMGEGDFLAPVVDRLLEAYQRDVHDGDPLADLGECILAVELHRESYDHSRRQVTALLKAKGLSAKHSEGLASRWLKQGDFLLLEPPRLCRRPPSLALRRASGAHQIPIVDFLCFRRRYVPERAEQPMVVIPVNPFERGELDVLERTP